MNNNAVSPDSIPEYPREIYEPVISKSMELAGYLQKELTVSCFDLDGDHVFKTCYGDIKKTIDALMDYTSLLDTICEQWKLEGYHRAMYEYHSNLLREFAAKLQTAIGYDYAATLEKCRKKQKRKREDKDDNIGADGITLAAKRRKAPDKNGTDSGDTEDKESPDGKSKDAVSGENGEAPDGNAGETASDRHDSLNEEPPKDDSAVETYSVSANVSAEAENRNVSDPRGIAPNPPSAGTEPPASAESVPPPPEHSYKVTLETIRGGTPMDKNELRTALEGHLDTLKRNLAVVSLDELKTKYKKPFDELRHNISATATAYVKQAALENLRIRQDFLEEARPIIQDTIDQSGLLRQISEAAFRRQDMDEIDRLVLDLKFRISLALDPFYERHLRLYMKKTPPAEFYNEATGCIWRNGAWVPMEVGRDAVLLPVLNIPKAAA